MLSTQPLCGALKYQIFVCDMSAPLRRGRRGARRVPRFTLVMSEGYALDAKRHPMVMGEGGALLVRGPRSR